MSETLCLAVVIVVAVAWARRGLTRWVLGMIERHVPCNRMRPELDLPGAGGDTVVLALHGTACNAETMRYLGGALGREGYPVWFHEYPYQRSIPENVERLARLVQERVDALGARAPARIVVVGYSQGGILARWLVSAGLGAAWIRRVVAVVQIGSPNAGAPPALLERVAWRGWGRTAFPSMVQMTPGSRFLASLGAMPLPPGVGLGVIHGLGPGRALIERFLYGSKEDRLWTVLVGAVYEWLFLRACEHDGLVPSQSALAVYALPGLESEPDPVLVPTDHLGLLGDRRAAEALVELVAVLAPRTEVGT